jgi:hypothetical protein
VNWCRFPSVPRCLAVMRLDARRVLADNRAMSVADQARYPGSALCRFLDSRLPQRAVVAEEWAGCAASAPWTPVWLSDSESRQRVGLAAEMRIGLDLGDAPAYGDLLSFLSPAEYGLLIEAAGFSPDASPVAVSGTADPLLLDWRRVQQPISYDDGQQAALAACLAAAAMRNVWTAYSDRPIQARRLSLAYFRSDIAASHSEHPERGNKRDGDLEAFANLWEGYLAHGRRQLADVDCGRVILEPELGGGYGVADLVVGRCLIEVKTAYDPAAAINVWLNQVLGYVLLDWSDALGVDTVAVYLGWQALLVSETLTRVLAAATAGRTPSLEDLRADFHSEMQADMDESFATRMRQRYPPFVTPA